jgi:SAM-dependent methyltransferase
MRLRLQRKQWDYFAAVDPFWAILTDSAKKNGGWTTDEFFATGRAEIRNAIAYAKRLGFPAARQRALDFGCGTGRATQALAEWFDQVIGVDVSPSMLDLARQHNRAGERCTYVLNAVDNLRQFEDNSFDLVYSRIVLQHLPPRIARRYVAEFVRILRPRGLALFQLTSSLCLPGVSRRVLYKLVLFAGRRILRQPDLMEMYGVPRNTVVRDLETAGARVIEVTPDNAAGPEWESFLYAITK